ncbi:DNA damage-regulated autophagy modulator protein 1 isoform X2 [Gouania willdenowi]|uniref:CWH43-like N-terminal domain-containing protein n=1 Tax=Gouania willdenowi TaxID=441366 RepID=A0A8C5E6W8_GOUWI|nr:DNA damage-regulated autophagy modulator protein 1 isoform X2 [Gouania willdenowi]
MCWLTRGLCWLPLFLWTWSSCSFLVSYLVSVLRHDVDVIFPYISDTAAKPPESCIFGLMTVVSAFAGIATIYARYKYVDKLNEGTIVVHPQLNSTAFWLGMISCLGMCIVATFQEFAVNVVHLIGAGLFFISGVLYVILQSYISYKAHPLGSSRRVCWTRAGIASLATLAFFPTVVCACLIKQDAIHVDPKDKDYPLHMASAACEWIVTFSFIFFFLTFIDDFKLFTLRVVSECGDGPSAYAPVSRQQQENPSAVHL